MTRRRLRRTSKWIASLGAALLFATWLASLPYHVTIRHPNTWRVEVSAGVVRINWRTGPHSAAPGPTEYDAGRHSAPLEWRPRLYRRVGWPGFILPLWLPIGVATLTSTALWRWDRPPSAGLCPGCRYDRTGLPGTVPCPECGCSSPAVTAPGAAGR